MLLFGNIYLGTFVSIHREARPWRFGWNDFDMENAIFSSYQSYLGMDVEVLSSWFYGHIIIQQYVVDDTRESSNILWK